MFHYTLRTQSSIVSLEKEIDYVKAYLQLQKLRYGESLKIYYQIRKRPLRALVPFNFLQPIVENAFVHGFTEEKTKRIKLEVMQNEDMVVIHVSNSGKQLSQQECVILNQGMISTASHGLSMIYQKLRYVYGQDFSISIGRRKNKDTCFSVCFPIRMGQEDGV